MAFQSSWLPSVHLPTSSFASPSEVCYSSRGIKKFLFAEQWGSGRFAPIGIPVPGFMGRLVGMVETVCRVLLVLGLFTRLSSLPLIIDIRVAIATTKIPIYLKAGFR